MSCYRPPPPPPPPPPSPPSRSWPTSSSPSSPLSRFHLLILVMFLFLAPTPLILMLAKMPFPFLKPFFQTWNTPPGQNINAQVHQSHLHLPLFNRFQWNVFILISRFWWKCFRHDLPLVWTEPFKPCGGHWWIPIRGNFLCFLLSDICWFIFCFQNKIKPRCDFRSLAGLKMVFWGQGRVEERSKFMFLWSFIKNNKIRWLFVIGTNLMQLIITMGVNHEKYIFTAGSVPGWLPAVQQPGLLARLSLQQPEPWQPRWADHRWDHVTTGESRDHDNEN